MICAFLDKTPSSGNSEFMLISKSLGLGIFYINVNIQQGFAETI